MYLSYMIQDKWDFKSEQVPTVGSWAWKQAPVLGARAFPRCPLQQAVTSMCHHMSRDPKLAHPGEGLHLPGSLSVQ